MNLSKLSVPRTGPFNQGVWNGEEYLVVQRRWMSAVLCWVVAAVLIGLIVAGLIMPRSIYVPERDQFPLFLTVAGCFGALGVGIARWKRVWIVNPEKASIGYASGLVVQARDVIVAPEGLWGQVHPIEIAAKGALSWKGFAAVIHATEGTGVITAVARSQEAAADLTYDLCESMEVPRVDELGKPLSAKV